MNNIYHINIDVQQKFIIKKIKSSLWVNDDNVIYYNKLKLYNINNVNYIEINVNDNVFDNYHFHMKVNNIITSNLYKTQKNICLNIEDNTNYKQDLKFYLSSCVLYFSGFVYCNITDHFFNIIKQETTVVNTNTEERYNIYLTFLLF